jgi:hypothetical protein
LYLTIAAVASASVAPADVHAGDPAPGRGGVLRRYEHVGGDFRDRVGQSDDVAQLGLTVRAQQPRAVDQRDDRDLPEDVVDGLHAGPAAGWDLVGVAALDDVLLRAPAGDLVRSEHDGVPVAASVQRLSAVVISPVIASRSTAVCRAVSMLTRGVRGSTEDQTMT